jgi:hypothetical protein
MTTILAAALFIVTTGGVVIAISVGVGRLGPTPFARRRASLATAAALLVWIGFTAALAVTGALSDFSALPPPIAPVIIGGNLAAIVIAASALGRRLALETPLAWLVGLQVFRVGVEVCLALLHHVGIVPVQMTFAGQNWDILVGLTAVPIAWLTAQGRLSRPWLLVWNGAGLGLLLNIVVISIRSTPTVLRAFPEEPANTFIATAPYIWLPSLLVPVALGAHLLVFRALHMRGAARATTSTRPTQ